MYVRTGGERDLAAVSLLIGDALHATNDVFYGVETVEHIARALYSDAVLKLLVARPTSEFLVADDGESLGGVAIAAAAVEDGRAVDILAFFVRPSLQGRGIGGMLLRELEDSFFESERMRIEVDERNLRAFVFAEAEGYARSGQRRDETLQATLVTLEKSLA
jgi:ribosomal protein S18 acetylase RimI-like enzyme